MASLDSIKVGEVSTDLTFLQCRTAGLMVSIARIAGLGVSNSSNLSALQIPA